MDSATAPPEPRKCLADSTQENRLCPKGKHETKILITVSIVIALAGRIESLTKRGKLVAYEAHIKTDSKRSEIQVGPNGEKLTDPE